MFWFPPGQWRMPDAISGVESDFRIFAHIAQMSEQAKMDAIFFADSVTSQPVDLIAKGASYGEQIPRGAGLEPMTTLAALATLTSRIGLIATGTTTYNEPYHIARRFATIDQGFPDGLKTDRRGNVYTTGGPGLLVFSAAGALLREIELPGAVNFAFAGDRLLVTADDAIWSIPLQGA